MLLLHRLPRAGKCCFPALRDRVLIDLSSGSAKKEVSFATEKRDSDTDKKKENEKLINGMTPTGRPFRQGSKLGDAFGGDRGQEDDEDDVDEVEHYLNLSVIHIIKELLSWKSRYLFSIRNTHVGPGLTLPWQMPAPGNGNGSAYTREAEAEPTHPAVTAIVTVFPLFTAPSYPDLLFAWIAAQPADDQQAELLLLFCPFITSLQRLPHAHPISPASTERIRQEATFHILDAEHMVKLQV